jgi:glycerol uptake operon antiterminator
MIEEIAYQRCIPVVATMKKLEQFLASDLTWCVLQDIHISMLNDMITMLHRNERKALVHIEMINGVANDEYGTEFLCQKLRVDGIISSKAKIIEIAKRNRKLAIQRMFLIDGRSVERGIEMLLKSQPDAVEVMPAVAYKAIPFVKERLNMPLIGGGLLRSKEDIDDGTKAGCVAFTISDLQLCKENCRR